MRNALFLGIFLKCLLAIAQPVADLLQDDPKIFDLAKLQSGMQGVGYTVYSSLEGPESFGFEVLGVMKNFPGPGGKVVIARLKSERFVNTGVAAGMSGSPAYIGDELLGAVAYSFGDFVKEPIAGITPIKDMLCCNSWSAQNSQVKPLGVPMVAVGLMPQTLATFEGPLRKMGYEVVVPGAGLIQKGTQPARFRAADPIAAVIVSGDMSLAGIGTVTWVKGDQFAAFGHPMMQVGMSSLPVAFAEVVTTVFSQANAYKLGQPLNLSGSLTDDRVSGISGQLGSIPPMADIQIQIDGQTKKMKLAEVRGDIPMFASMVLANTLFSRANRELGGTLRIKGELIFSEGVVVPVDRVIAADNSGIEWLAAQGLAQDLTVLVEQPLKEVKLKKIDLAVTHSKQVDLARLAGLVIDTTPKLGDPVKGRLQFRRWQRPANEMVFSVALPKGVKPGDYQLLALDRPSAIELEKESGLLFDWPDYQTMALQYARLPKDKQVCLYLVRSDNTKRVNGYSLNDLPPSFRQLLSKNFVGAENLVSKTAYRLDCLEANAVVTGSVSGAITL